MISAVSFSLDPMLQTVRKPDTESAPIGVTGASSATAPQTRAAVKTVSGSAEMRNDNRQPSGEEAAQAVAEQAEERTRLEVSHDKDSGKRVFKRVVASNSHVLWQEPEEKVLQRAKDRHQSTGLLTDKTV